MSVYYGQPPPPQVIVPQPIVAQPRIVVAPQLPVTSPTVIIDHGRRSRSLSRSRFGHSRSRSRSRPRIVKHKHTHTFNLRGKNRRSKTRKRSSGKRIKTNIGDEHAFKKVSQRMHSIVATGTPLEVFLHANAEHVDELPDGLRLQWALAAAFKNKEALALTLRENGQEVFTARSLFSRQVTERTIDVEYNDFGGEEVRLAMTDKLEFVFNDDESLTRIVAVLPPESGDPWSSIRLNLYEDIHHEAHAEHQLPTVYATFKFKKSSTTIASYTIESVCISVDFIPNRETAVTHTTHIDVLPELRLASLDVVRWGRESYTRPLHAMVGEELAQRFSKVKRDQSSHWQLISNDDGGEYGSTTSRTHNVLWGEIADVFLARAILDFLEGTTNANDLDSPDYLVELFSTTENGRALVELVDRLYRDLHPESTLVDRQSFPTLRQVLRHTTGLPSNTLLEYKDILEYYKTVVGKIGESGEALPDIEDDGASSSSDLVDVTDTAITDIIGQLQKFKTAEVDPDVVVGEHHNLFEALILFMFFRMAMKRTPLDVINQQARENAITLNWGMEAPTDPNDPFSLLTCAQSSLSDVVNFSKMIYDDLSRRDSLTARTLLDPVYLRVGEPTARTLGWYVHRTANNIDIIFSMQGKRSMLDTTLVYFIPELRAWGIINEFSRNFDRALCFDASCFLDVLVEAIEKLDDNATDDRPRHAIEFAPYAAYAHKYKAKDPIDRHLDLVGHTYHHPFMDPVTGKHAQVTLQRDDQTGNFQLVSVEGVRPLELGYTGHDDVFFKLEFPYKNGTEVTITPEYVSVNFMIFLDADKAAELMRTYKSALSFAQKKISMDIHAETRNRKLHDVKAHTMIAAQFFEEPVGVRFGPGRRWGFRRPYYRRPYGYGYGYGLGTAAALGTAAVLGAAAAYPPPYYYPYPPYAY